MSGFARRRGGTWTAYWDVRDEHGRRRQRSKGGFARKRDALDHLSTVGASLQAGTYAEPTKMTVREFFVERWLPAATPTLRPATAHSYRQMVDLHVLPELGGIRLQQLSADRLNRLYAEKLAGGRKDGKNGGLSPKSVRYLHTIVHKALADALQWNLVVRNVADGARPPKVERPSIRVWSADELRSFLTAMAGERLEAAFVLAATTGMRRGEVLGVRWSDVDLDAGQLAVRQTVLSIRNRIVFGEPKTTRGRRVVALDATTVAALKAHRARQAAEKLAMGAGYTDADLVFARPDGAPIHPDYFSQTFERAVGRLKLPRIRLHDLRHTHATIGLEAGVDPKIISDRLGHSTVSFTLDVYTHAIPAKEAEAAEKMAALVFGGASGA